MDGQFLENETLFEKIQKLWTHQKMTKHDIVPIMSVKRNKKK